MTYKARFTAYQRTNGTARSDGSLGTTWALTARQARRLAHKARQPHGERVLSGTR